MPCRQQGARGLARKAAFYSCLLACCLRFVARCAVACRERTNVGRKTACFCTSGLRYSYSRAPVFLALPRLPVLTAVSKAAAWLAGVLRIDQSSGSKLRLTAAVRCSASCCAAVQQCCSAVQCKLLRHSFGAQPTARVSVQCGACARSAPLRSSERLCKCVRVQCTRACACACASVFAGYAGELVELSGYVLDPRRRNAHWRRQSLRWLRPRARIQRNQP
jgi:hypothetical protein